MKKILLGLIALATVAFAVALFYPMGGAAPAKAEVAEPKPKPKLKSLEKSVATAAPTAIPKPPPAPADPKGPPPATAPSASTPKPMKAMMEMMKSPAMREAAKQQQLALNDRIFAGLFGKFQLDDAEKANFKQLLAERTSAEIDFNLKMMDDTLTSGQRQAMTQELEAAKKANSQKIKTFLDNDEDFKTFESWDETKGERIVLSMNGQAFAGEPLSPQQEQQLVDTMHQIAKQSKTIRNPGNSPALDPVSIDQPFIDQQLSYIDADALRLQQQAVAFLSPKQIDALKAMQQQWRAMQEMGLKMMSAMK